MCKKPKNDNIESKLKKQHFWTDEEMDGAQPLPIPEIDDDENTEPGNADKQDERNT